MSRIVIAHAVLLALSALAAWYSWQQISGDDPRARALVLNLAFDDLHAVIHDWPGGVTTVQITGAGREREVAVQLAVPDADADGF